VRGQRIEPVRHVDILVAEAIADDPYYESRLAVVREGLRDLGWIEGQNLRLDVHRTAPIAADIRTCAKRPITGSRDHDAPAVIGCVKSLPMIGQFGHHGARQSIALSLSVYCYQSDVTGGLLYMQRHSNLL
jgi:hypothetical protein